MRYANLVCDNLFTIKEAVHDDFEKKIWNVGDYIQILAIENLYKEMGINASEIVRIHMQELKTYKGEKLLLPINLIVYGDNFFEGADITISEDIVPVFLGVRFFHYYFSEKTKQYLKKFGPIGCRDESVLKKMQELDIPAYLGGCLTITLPQRNKEFQEKKVYLVDVPKGLYEYLPDWIKNNMVQTTSVYFMSKEKLLHGKSMKEFVENKYKEYYENASLVVTSRLHVASPCLAAGIPVILVRDSINDRFAWLDKFIKIYTLEEFSTIDWEKGPIDIKKEKQRLIKYAATIVRSQYERYSAMEKLNIFYDERERSVYQSSLQISIQPIIDYMNENWDYEKEELYAIWGWNIFAEEIIKYIKQYYPKAKLYKIFDTYRTFEKHGIIAQSPTGLKNNREFITFITSDAVAYIAEEYFKEHACNKEGYVLIEYGFKIQ